GRSARERRYRCHAGVMPATCPTCGEEALTETARFCVGCGGPLPEPDIGTMLAELADEIALREPEPASEPDAPVLHLPEHRAEPTPPPAPKPPPRVDRPPFEPRPVPARTEAQPPTP